MSLSDQAQAFQEFLSEVGGLVGHWAKVEYELAEILSAVLNARNDEYTLSVFYSVNSLEARISLTEAAMQALLRDPNSMSDDEKALVRSVWINAKARLLRLKKTRNKVAHGNIVNFIGDRVGMFLTPVVNDPRFDREQLPRPGLTVDDLRQSSSAVLRLFADLMDLRWALRAWQHNQPYSEKLLELTRRLKGEAHLQDDPTHPAPPDPPQLSPP